MKPKPEDLTDILCRLSLTTIAQHYEELSREAAREGLDHVEYLRRLAEAEAAARYERSVQRRTKAARLPVLKTLEQFDWAWPKKINRAQVQELFRLRFIEQNSNAVLIGGVGLGKTHLALALAHSACLHNIPTLFASAVEIVNRGYPLDWTSPNMLWLDAWRSIRTICWIWSSNSRRIRRVARICFSCVGRMGSGVRRVDMTRHGI